jgi:hypothetical protein
MLKQLRAKHAQRCRMRGTRREQRLADRRQQLTLAVHAAALAPRPCGVREQGQFCQLEHEAKGRSNARATSINQ